MIETFHRKIHFLWNYENKLTRMLLLKVPYSYPKFSLIFHYCAKKQSDYRPYPAFQSLSGKFKPHPPHCVCSVLWAADPGWGWMLTRVSAEPPRASRLCCCCYCHRGERWSGWHQHPQVPAQLQRCWARWENPAEDPLTAATLLPGLNLLIKNKFHEAGERTGTADDRQA